MSEPFKDFLGREFNDYLSREVRDFLGREIVVGQYVIAIEPQYRVLTIGRIVEITRYEIHIKPCEKLPWADDNTENVVTETFTCYPGNMFVVSNDDYAIQHIMLHSVPLK